MLEILFGNLVWKFRLEISYGNFVWKFRLKDRQTDRPTERLVEAPSRSLKKDAAGRTGKIYFPDYFGGAGEQLKQFSSVVED